MSSNKNNIQDKKELEKFIKFLLLKSTQIIIQSRQGEKIKTQNTENENSHFWFNIAIHDNPEVLAETKKVLNVNTGESIITRLPLCVEISLQTVEGDKMILEVWSIGIITDQSDPSLRPTYAVYNRMGLLLKSLISVTRVTPAYKLSRRQSSDSYNIYYRIYVGDPQVHNLGDGYKQVRVGELGTTIGALNMSVAYRTKMTISPTQTGRDNAIMLKSDHFLKDICPKQIRYNNKKNEKKIIDLDKPMRIGAFVDTTKTKQYTEDDYVLPEHPPFSWLLKKPKDEVIRENGITDDEKTISVATPTSNTTTEDNSSSTATVTNNNNSNLKSFESNDSNRTLPSLKTNDISSTSPTTNGIKSSRWSKPPPPEDERLLKELHFPFATNNTPISDLAKFYRDCFNAPPLNAFNEQQFVVEEQQATIDDLSRQLEQFETSLGDYDTLVTSLCTQSVDNNLNS